MGKHHTATRHSSDTILRMGGATYVEHSGNEADFASDLLVLTGPQVESIRQEMEDNIGANAVSVATQQGELNVEEELTPGVPELSVSGAKHEEVLPSTELKALMDRAVLDNAGNAKQIFDLVYNSEKLAAILEGYMNDKLPKLREEEVVNSMLLRSLIPVTNPDTGDSTVPGVESVIDENGKLSESARANLSNETVVERFESMFRRELRKLTMNLVIIIADTMASPNPDDWDDDVNYLVGVLMDETKRVDKVVNNSLAPLINTLFRELLEYVYTIKAGQENISEKTLKLIRSTEIMASSDLLSMTDQRTHDRMKSWMDTRD